MMMRPMRRVRRSPLIRHKHMQNARRPRCVPISSSRRHPNLWYCWRSWPRHYPVVRESILGRRDLMMGGVKTLVHLTPQEIDHLSAEPSWSNHWDEAGYTPDYSRVRDRLQAFPDKGHADEVIALGKYFQDAGTRHVELSYDERETVEAIVACLTVVFRALSRSSLSAAEQMLSAAEAELDDEYDLCRVAEQFWQQDYAAADWQSLVEKLTHRPRHFPSTPGEEPFVCNYCRDRLTNWLIYALEQSGRHDEIIAVYEREAEKCTATYAWFIISRRLTAGKRPNNGSVMALKPCRSIFQASPVNCIALRDLREKEENWLQVAAMHANNFFQHPTLAAFQKRQQSAERAHVWPAVRTGALHYLGRGVCPHPPCRAAKDRAIAIWPLPASGFPDNLDPQNLHLAIIGTLIAIAMEGNRPDEVLHRMKSCIGTTSASRASALGAGAACMTIGLPKPLSNAILNGH